MPKQVYLAGPISHLSYEEATEWRNYAIERLAQYGIIGLSPMRWKGYLKSTGKILDSYPAIPLSSDKGITTRDRSDVGTSDIIIANFLGATSASCGTPIEFGWADALRKPVIMVIEPEGNPFDHAMMREIAGYRVEALDEAIKIAVALLVPERLEVQANV